MKERVFVAGNGIVEVGHPNARDGTLKALAFVEIRPHHHLERSWQMLCYDEPHPEVSHTRYPQVNDPRDLASPRLPDCRKALGNPFVRTSLSRNRASRSVDCHDCARACSRNLSNHSTQTRTKRQDSRPQALRYRSRKRGTK